LKITQGILRDFQFSLAIANLPPKKRVWNRFGVVSQYRDRVFTPFLEVKGSPRKRRAGLGVTGVPPVWDGIPRSVWAHWVIKKKMKHQKKHGASPCEEDGWAVWQVAGGNRNAPQLKSRSEHPEAGNTAHFFGAIVPKTLARTDSILWVRKSQTETFQDTGI